MNQFMHPLALHDSRFKGFSIDAGGVFQPPPRKLSLPHNSPPPQVQLLLIVVLFDCRRGTGPALFMTARREIVESPSETGAQSREAGLAPPGSSEGGAPPSWGFYKGAGPLVRVGEAGSRAGPERERHS